MSTFTERMIGAVTLDAQTYEEVEADTTATTQAMGVVVLSSLAQGIGFLTQFQEPQLLQKRQAILRQHSALHHYRQDRAHRRLQGGPDSHVERWFHQSIPGSSRSARDRYEWRRARRFYNGRRQLGAPGARTALDRLGLTQSDQPQARVALG